MRPSCFQLLMRSAVEKQPQLWWRVIERAKSWRARCEDGEERGRDERKARQGQLHRGNEREKHEGRLKRRREGSDMRESRCFPYEKSQCPPTAPSVSRYF
ncbi:Hypothetical predicted protein [Xyrichtys novacula]|uniref:Uncharacterized protein n=1 Tax=Xyrichtys novacula TaxID=13765 RepID=A0AAV1F0Q5_XYRNO|nr:Hypothetical predicted protein [Xyrichtys novacula]